jgi:stage II sporulation protein D
VFAAGEGRVTAANVVALEQYLLGVVPAEIPSLEVEAVKAQAVAARTYAVRNMGRREARGFDLFATVADQVYGGLEVEDPMATRAVTETRGEILTYRGSPIMAYYHSTCGGRTAAIDEVWDDPPEPYLVSVSDEIPGTGGYYCEASNRFRWIERWSGPELSRILSEGMREQMGVTANDHALRVSDIEVVGRTPSGRAAAIEIRADGETVRAEGDSIRWVLRPEPDRILNSTLFSLETVREAGEVVHLEAHGGGWGHGIGMCQMGAIGRASAGQGYREILGAYYRGAEVVRIY